jgi:hypothetical protein
VRVHWDVNVKSPIVLFSQGVSTSAFRLLIPKSSEDFISSANTLAETNVASKNVCKTDDYKFSCHNSLISKEMDTL